jgi:hypothetical protein
MMNAERNTVTMRKGNSTKKLMFQSGMLLIALFGTTSATSAVENVNVRNFAIGDTVIIKPEYHETEFGKWKYDKVIDNDSFAELREKMCWEVVNRNGTRGFITLKVPRATRNAFNKLLIPETDEEGECEFFFPPVFQNEVTLYTTGSTEEDVPVTRCKKPAAEGAKALLKALKSYERVAEEDERERKQKMASVFGRLKLAADADNERSAKSQMQSPLASTPRAPETPVSKRYTITVTPPLAKRNPSSSPRKMRLTEKACVNKFGSKKYYKSLWWDAVRPQQDTCNQYILTLPEEIKNAYKEGFLLKKQVKRLEGKYNGEKLNTNIRLKVNANAVEETDVSDVDMAAKAYLILQMSRLKDGVPQVRGEEASTK